MQNFELFGFETRALFEGGELRPVQDLVRVGVPDPRKEMGVSEAALEGVIFALQRVGKRLEVALEGLDAAGIVLGQSRFTLDQVQGGALLGARFGRDERSRREIEGAEPAPAWRLGTGFLP